MYELGLKYGKEYRVKKNDSCGAVIVTNVAAAGPVRRVSRAGDGRTLGKVQRLGDSPCVSSSKIMIVCPRDLQWRMHACTLLLPAAPAPRLKARVSCCRIYTTTTATNFFLPFRLLFSLLPFFLALYFILYSVEDAPVDLQRRGEILTLYPLRTNSLSLSVYSKVTRLLLVVLILLVAYHPCLTQTTVSVARFLSRIFHSINL